eukprot:TRINITY_DN22604_c0_g1_i1.p1 TRINITY_DN22604_c0_g1~~TRINITY_DN22604_c0_g1_i1.p1  ORF type:complete len:203 (-),score=63.51 TRINITY_DN22604_c0_g1_i1:63-671(-)
MGGNSVKGLVLMETIWPSTDGKTVFENPQIAQALAKEMKKGTIKPPTKADEVDVDEDLDPKIVDCVGEVWSYYDPKGTGVLPKKMAQKFLTDAWDLYVMRRGAGVKEKDVLGPGVSKGKAMDDCYNAMSGGAQQVTKAQFESYIFCTDLEEAMGPLTGKSGGVTINSRLPQNMMFDVNSLPKESSSVDMKNIQYRNYESTVD